MTNVKGPFVNREQQEYVRSHPLALSFCVGLAIIGFIALFFPGLLEENSTSLVLPEWLQMLFSLTYFVGGTLGAYGMIRGNPKAEAAAMSLIASGLLVQYLTIVYLTKTAAVGGIFILTLSAGCAMRARYLRTRGQRRV